MLIEVSNTLTVENPTSEMVLWCKRNLTIPNPDYAKKSRMNLWLGNTPKVLSLYETRGTTLVLPFGTLRLLPKDISDKALFLSEFAAPVEVNYNADVPLYDYQETAVQAMVAAKYGILQSAAGSGKTQMGIALAARLGRRTLWLCHTLDLIKQSKERAKFECIEVMLETQGVEATKIRIMPDVHAGAGCVIGFTADLGDKVIPNIVGVDIGCGMLTVELGKIDIDFDYLDKAIRENVPSGREVNETATYPTEVIEYIRCYKALKDPERLVRSIGSLGGGNHFIEIDTDSEGVKYLVIHTGSRNLGKQVAEYYQNLAIETMQGKDELIAMQKKLIADYKKQGRKAEIQKAIAELHRKFSPNPLGIPKELCYLTGKHREDYLHDMKACQHFAATNRYEIANRIVSSLFGSDIAYWDLPMFETVHNYIEFGTNMVRKWAISAKAGEKLLIPINMRDGCIIGIGKGNEDWNCSAPHGAGRVMSRSKAKELVSLEEYEDSMKGIFTTSVSRSTIDESPMVYKTMEEIIANIADTVEVVNIIKPVYNFKASE